MSITVITNAGITAAIAAGSSGPNIQITSFKIGSSLITPAATMTDVDSEVYEGTSSQIQYQIVGASDIVYSVTLDPTVGNFDVGNIGLYLADGTLFSITSLAAINAKTQTDLPVVGDTHKYNVAIHLDGQVSITNLTLLLTEESTIPEVDTEGLLPDPTTSVFALYLVKSNSIYSGAPTLASRVSGVWYYYPTASTTTTPSSTLGQTFGASVVDRDVVYNDAGTWERGDGTDSSKGGFGVKSAAGEVVINGLITGYTGLTAGTSYFAGVAGGLTNVPNVFFIGTAISTTDILIRAEHRPDDTSDEIYVDSQTISPGVSIGDLVYYETLTSLWSLADGTDDAKGANAVVLKDFELKFNGIYEAPSATFTLGVNYYADNVGGYTDDVNNWYVGTAISTTEILLSVGSGLAINSTPTTNAIPNPTLGSGVVPGSVVYNNNGIWDLADGTVSSKGGFGIIDASNNLVINGQYTNYSGLTTGEEYYSDTGGALTATENLFFIGTAISSTTLNVRAEKRAVSFLTDQTWGGGVSAGVVVYNNAGTWDVADGTNPNKGGFGIAVGADGVMLTGIITGLSGLAVGTEYYAGTLGTLTPSTNEYFIGTALSNTTMMVRAGFRSVSVISGQALGVGVIVGSVVYNNSGVWDTGDGNNENKGGYAVALGSGQILLNGLVTIYTGLTVGAEYYAGSAGSVTTIANKFFIGTAISTTTMIIRAEYRGIAGGIAELTGQTWGAGVIAGSVVYNNSGTWDLGDGTDDSKGGFGIAVGTNSVAYNGSIITTGLITGTNYYSGVLGSITATINPYFIGTAVSTTELALRAEKRGSTLGAGEGDGSGGGIEYEGLPLLNQVWAGDVVAGHVVHNDAGVWGRARSSTSVFSYDTLGYGIAVGTDSVLLSGIVHNMQLRLTNGTDLVPGSYYYTENNLGDRGNIELNESTSFVGVAISTTSLAISPKPHFLEAGNSLFGLVETSSLGDLNGSRSDGVPTTGAVRSYIASEVPSSTETVKGRIELATETEATTGTDTTRAITPATLGAVIEDKVPEYTNGSRSLTYTLTKIPVQVGGVFVDMIIQQGQYTGFNGSVVFPLSFPTAIMNCNLQPTHNSNIGNGNVAVTNLKSKSLSGFSFSSGVESGGSDTFAQADLDGTYYAVGY